MNETAIKGAEMAGSDIAARKRRWGRMMAGADSSQHLLLVRYEPDNLSRPLALPELMAERTEFAWQQWERAVARTEWLHDDFVPHLDCLTGTEIFAEAFGCGIHRPPESQPCAQPLVFNAAEAAKVKVPSLDAPPLRRMFEMADELKRRAGGRVGGAGGAIFRPVDIQSPMDIAALIWEKSDFLLAMIESPEAVKELAGKCRSLLIAFLDEWQRRYGREHVAHFPEYFMPYGITLSEDEIGVVNNEMFEELFLPELAALSEHFGQIGIHCCANSEHQWKCFHKIPNLRFLNLAGHLGTKAYRFFADTQVIQMHCTGTPEGWDQVIADNPRARLYIEVGAKTRDEALRLVEKYRDE
ncbi:MAG: uroporphyrinogen decarboxylase family protein [Phycisphaerae bacterium]